ncbi:MAG: DUF6600 domain-containing protein [Terracidiphilus sp.]
MLLFARASVRILLLALAAALPVLASNSLYAQDDPPAEVGRLAFLSGSVSIQPAGSDDWGQALPNDLFAPGDRVFTDSNSHAEIQVGQTFIRIGPNSDVSFVEDTPYSISIGLAQGAVHIHSFGFWPDQRLYVNTPNGSGGLDQPGDLRVDVLPDENAAIFTNFGGQAFAGGPGYFAATIRAGQALELIGSNPVFPQWLQPAGWDDLDNWSYLRDQQIANALSYRYVSPEIPGASELDACGTWMPDTGYGAIWFPDNVPADWMPYHDGRWVNHAPWGWVWVENESWGYAPFHYGRWVFYDGRWGWIPGPVDAHPVWSPALVVFAGGLQAGGTEITAWFPLGPGEPYRPWYHASPRYIDQINLSNIRESRRVHVQTTYVNIVNVTNITYVNRTIGVSAMRQQDFADGRSARRAAVAVDSRQLQQVRALAAPQSLPNPRPLAGHAPSRPVRVSGERPAFINESGKLVSSRPGAQPMEPPVKAVPQPRVLPGRIAVAPPSGVGEPVRTFAAPAAPTSRPAPFAAPVTRPASSPVERPMDWGARPPASATPAERPAFRPTANPVVQPAFRPATEPAAWSAAPPTAKPPARPVAVQPYARPQQDKRTGENKRDEKKPKN